MKQPVLFDGWVTFDCLKVIVEPDSIAKRRVMEVEVVSWKSRSINEDDTSTSADVGGPNAGNSSTPSYSLSYEEEQWEETNPHDEGFGSSLYLEKDMMDEKKLMLVITLP